MNVGDLIFDTKILYVAIGALSLIVYYIIKQRNCCVSKCDQSLKQNICKVLNSYHPEELVCTHEAEECIPDDEVRARLPILPNTINLIKQNYLNLLDNAKLKEVAEICIRNNGVGSCGPRGFYGTIDIHLNLEDKIAEFMGMEETVLYSYGFSTIASAIPAYCKKGDVIFCDEKITFSAKEGMNAAKSAIVYFKHNDVEDLEDKLIEHAAIIAKMKRDATSSGHSTRNGSKFLIVEGIYALTGNICPLPQLMELRKKYMLRIFIDESVSFGVLGRCGRGVTEHFNIDRSNVDMIVGSLEGAIGSIGGFCVGASVIIEHQRLSGLGYCFSASLPPFLSAVAISAIDMFQAAATHTPLLFKSLEDVSTKVHALLEDNQHIRVISHPLSPVKVFTSCCKDLKLINQLCIDEKLHLNLGWDSISFCVQSDMDDALMLRIVAIIKDASIPA